MYSHFDDCGHDGDGIRDEDGDGHRNGDSDGDGLEP